MFPRLRSALAVFAILGSTLRPVPAVAQRADAHLPKLDIPLSDLVRNGASARQRVIIRAAAGELPALTSILRARGHALAHVHSQINAVTVSVPVGALLALSRLNSVSSISIDAVVTADQSPSTYTLRETLGLPVQAPAGNRIGVAVIDSGLQAGSEFGDRILGFYDFTQGGIATSPSDAYGHGTHVAGLIAANGGLFRSNFAALLRRRALSP